MAKGACKIVGEYVSVYFITHIELHSSMKKFCYFSASNASFADHVSRRAMLARLRLLMRHGWPSSRSLRFPKTCSWKASRQSCMISCFSHLFLTEEVILDLVRLISFSFKCFAVNFSTRCRAWRSTTYMRPLSRSTFQTLRCFQQLCRATGSHLRTFSS